MLEHFIPDNILAQIGDLTVSFSLLESTVQRLAGSFINEHQRLGDIVTAELSFRGLRSLVTSLYLDRHGEDAEFDRLRELMKRAAQLEDTRNQITHSVWIGGEAPYNATRTKKTAKEAHGFRFQLEDIDEAALRRVVESVKVLAHDIQVFWIQLIQNGKAINNPVQKQWGPLYP